MAMEQSILKSTKKILGIDASYTAFDLDVLTWINAACSTLRGLGLGPEGFYVEDDTKVWADFGEDVEDTGMIKTYVYLRTKIMFDPPNTTYVLAAMQEQIREQEFRLSTNRENRDWVNPNPVVSDTDEVISSGDVSVTQNSDGTWTINAPEASA